MLCGEHGCPPDQCQQFTHARDLDNVERAYAKGLAHGLELAFESGVPLENRRGEILALLLFIRERL